MLPRLGSNRISFTWLKQQHYNEMFLFQVSRSIQNFCEKGNVAWLQPTLSIRISKVLQLQLEWNIQDIFWWLRCQSIRWTWVISERRGHGEKVYREIRISRISNKSYIHKGFAATNDKMHNDFLCPVSIRILCP